MEDNYREVKKAEPCLKLIHMDQVEVEEIEWLFYPFIPYGKPVRCSRELAGEVRRFSKGSPDSGRPCRNDK